jgi:hypothetical protein
MKKVKHRDADVKYIHSECFGTRCVTFANRYCPGKLPRESRMEDWKSGSNSTVDMLTSQNRMMLLIKLNDKIGMSLDISLGTAIPL